MCGSAMFHVYSKRAALTRALALVSFFTNERCVAVLCGPLVEQPLGGALSGEVPGGCSSRFHTLPLPTASVLVVWSSTSEGLVALQITALTETVGLSAYSSYEGSVWVWRGR